MINHAQYAAGRCVSIRHVAEALMGTPVAMLVIGRNQNEISYTHHSHRSPCGTLEEGHALTGDKKEANFMDTILRDRRPALI